ncbi:putative ribonuclease H-like domain-containing protein [Tanacetum coccineum]
MYSFFANQSSGPQLDHEDLEQLDEFDLEEMDLKWQVAMISMRLKKFYKKTGKRLQFDAKEPVGFNKTKVECFNCHKTGHFTRECRSKGNQESVDWTGHVEDEQENFALMAYSNSGSDTEREQLGDASIEIQSYTQALKKVETQLVAHQKNQLWYEKKIRFMKIDLDDKTDVLTYHKKLLAEAVKEKEELKTKLENFQSSSKGLSKLLNSQMSTRDKSGLGLSDVEDSPVHDRFANVEGMHAVPPPMTGNYMPSGPDREVDDSMFTYGPKQSKTSESDTQTSNFDSCESNSSVETLESVPEPVVVEPKVVSQPKVLYDAPIIEEYESDSDDEYVIQPSKEQEKPSFAFVNTVKHVKTPRETVKEQNTYSPSPKADKRDWNGLMSKRLGLGYGFTKKACFVCGGFSYLIRDCDFHEKRMAKQVELNKKKGKGTGQGENRPVWNNVQRLNHQNKFVPKAVLTKTGIFLVNTARQNLSSQAATTSTARKVNTARPIVNEIRPRNNFYKSHSPIRRPFNRTTTPKANFSNQKVNTAEVKAVSVVGGIRETAVKPSAGCNWRPKRHYWNKVSKYNSGSSFSKNVNFKDPLGRPKALKNKGIVDSRCSRHMTSNKAYLVEYQDYNGGPVAFGGSKGYITGKDTECLVLSSDFKLPNENQVLLRIPIQNNMYSFNLENIVPSGGLAYLIAKATVDESNKWYRRLSHVNIKNLNKLVKGNLVRGLPSNIFQNDHAYVACQKGKQHKALCKANIVSSISQRLQLLHMDLFGPTSVRSINHKTYCLVIIDDFSRDIIEFRGSKGIKREYSNVRTSQQNGVAERKYRSHIEAARTMLADSFLPNTFWAEAVSYAFVMYLSLGYTVRTEINANNCASPEEVNHSAGTQDTINARNSKMKVNPAQDYFVLPICSSYTSTVKSSEAKNEGEKPNKDTGLKTNEEPVDQEDQAFLEELERLKRQEKEANDAAEALRKEFAQEAEDLLLQAGAARATSTNTVNTIRTPVSTASSSGGPSYPDLTNYADQDDSQIPALEDIYDNLNDGIFTNASYDDEGAVADFTNLESTMNEELLQFKIQKNKASLVAQRYRQEEGIDYDEVFALVARIEAIRIFLAFASYMGFIVYQMDVKSAFLYGTIDKEVYLSQPLGFVDPKFPKKVYKVVKALYGLHQAPRSWYDTLSTFLLKSGYKRGAIDETLFIKKDKNDIMLVQVYVDDIIFGSTKSTPIETQKSLTKDEEAADVDVHLYRSMIGSLMYLTASRPDIMNLDNPKKKFLMYPRFLMVFLNNQIKLGEPFNDVYPTPAHNLKVFTNMSRKGLKFSGKVTPLFDCMLRINALKLESKTLGKEVQVQASPTIGHGLRNVEKIIHSREICEEGVCIQSSGKRNMSKPNQLWMKYCLYDQDADRLTCKQRLNRKRQREEEASKAAIAEMYDEVQAGIDADALFAGKLQQEEREEYTIEESKFLG